MFHRRVNPVVRQGIVIALRRIAGLRALRAVTAAGARQGRPRRRYVCARRQFSGTDLRPSNRTAQLGERHRGCAAKSRLRAPCRQIVTPGLPDLTGRLAGFPGSRAHGVSQRGKPAIMHPAGDAVVNVLGP